MRFDIVLPLAAIGVDPGAIRAFARGAASTGCG
jgi:hypothetical protein